jgi:ribosomal protein L5
MYNFLEKLITILFQSYDYKIQIHKQEIQITLSNREIRLFPEIQNHFEFFECVQSFQVTIITSSSNEKETQLLWAGLHQKEI